MGAGVWRWGRGQGGGLCCRYTGRLHKVTVETVVPLLEASQRLQAPHAEACSIKWLTAHLSVANCVGIWDAAGRFSCATLLERALEFFARHICEVVQSEGFLALESCKLIELMSDNSLCLRDEKLVYGAVMGWVEHDLAARQALVCEVLGGVRLGLLPGPFLANEVGRYLLMQSHEAKELRIRAYDCKFQGSVEDTIGRQRRGAAYTVPLLEQHACVLHNFTHICAHRYTSSSRAELTTTGKRLDMSIGKWQSLPLRPRTGFGAVSLDGKLCVAGGDEGSDSDDEEAFLARAAS